MIKNSIIAIVLCIVLIAFLWVLQNEKGSKTMVVKASFPAIRAIEKYDPAKIHSASEYILLEHLYSSLVEISLTGALEPGLAKKFYWKGNNAYFELRDDQKTIDDHQITAKDVEFSIKRLLVLASNTHGSISSLLCKDGPLENIESDCPGIKVEGNTIIFMLSKKNSFLFHMFASTDFAIIPRRSVDPKTLQITNYRNTSGPYYYESLENDEITMSAKKDHYAYDRLMPQKVVLKKITTSGSSVKALRDGNIDLISSVDFTPASELIEYANKHNDISIHETLKIKTDLLRFTDRGLTELSLQRRFVLGKKIRDIYTHEVANKTGHDVTLQFLPNFGEGSLTDNQLEELKDKFAQDTTEETGKGITLLTSSKHIDFMRELLSEALPDLRIEKVTKSPSFSKEVGSMGHIYIINTDAGFLEDISLITYSIKAGTFDLNHNEGEKWLAEYMSTDDKKERLAKLNGLHFKTLMNAHIVPLYVAPYVTLANNNWEMNFSEFYGNNQLWLLRKN